MKTSNELLGYFKCAGGSRAEVYQAKRAGRHFYTRCAVDCCGLNQATGQRRQQDIYDNAEFLPGVTVVRPTGVTESVKPVGEPQPDKTEKLSEPEPKKQPEPSTDFDPSSSEREPENAPVSRNLSRFLPGVILLAAAGVGAWMG